ncbi:aspartate/glutamate racemase family protein [Ancylobacter sp. FA202]|uniref:aspartate/glutamate racemase family protein n=1 Tax=Ancylobacter sp. FA202 TaxID=1111106 RepID=UPI0003614305|nr:amino acid racemase [Ancylobacter sp. FA202]
MPRRVGILGGMGPQATVLLMSRVIAAVPAADDRDHVPLIVDQNPQVPSRIARLIEGTGEDPAPVLVAMARRLEAAGVEALAMPCNTAHHFAPAITAAVGIPLLDMVALSVAHAARLTGTGGRVGVIASPALRRIGLFDGSMAQAGLTAVYPDDEAALLGAIRRIKAGGVDAGSRDIFRRASAQLLAAGVATQMIACTEFSLLADSAEEGAKAFDTLDVLVGAIVDFSLARDA